jgi:hypothetical protein
VQWIPARGETFAVDGQRLTRQRKKVVLKSSRAKRGISFFANPKKKADPPGKPRPRDDTFGVFLQAVKPVEFRAAFGTIETVPHKDIRFAGEGLQPVGLCTTGSTSPL